MDKHAEQRRSEFFRRFGGIALFAIGSAYFAQPLIKFASPGLLFLAGSSLSIATTALYGNMVHQKKWDLWASIIFGTIGFIAIGITGEQAMRDSQAADRYCLVLQQKLTAGKASDKDANIFQAFGCRPRLGGGYGWIDDL